MHINNIYHMLLQEGHLFQSCILSGLTSLRQASIKQKGIFYSAFFQLSIGIERILKVCLILDHMSKNNLKPPTQSDVKKFGHDLNKLYDAVINMSPSISKSRNLKWRGSKTSIEAEILGLLNKFAKTSRYHNLDSISSVSKDVDPLEHWNSISLQILREEVSAKRIEAIKSNSLHIASLLQNTTVILAYDMNKRPMDIYNFIADPHIQNVVSHYAIWKLVCILKPVRAILEKVTKKSIQINLALNSSEQMIPDVHDFLDFTYRNKRDVLRVNNCWKLL